MTRDTFTYENFSYEDLGAHLRALREAAGFQQGELAEVLGISGSKACHIEVARNRPSIETLFAWSMACGRPLTLVWAEPDAQPLEGADLDVALRMPRGPVVQRRAKLRRVDASGFDLTTRRYEVTP